jgi:hypothetical protein
MMFMSFKNVEPWRWILVGAVVCYYFFIVVFALLISKQKQQEVNVSVPVLHYAPEKDQLRNLIESLPDMSPMKVNLTVVLASELNGESQELSDLLAAYARYKLKYLEKESP